MIIRTFDVKGFSQACEQVKDIAIGYDPVGWISNTDNIVLTDGQRNYSMFERTAIPHVAVGHYLLSARGRQAIDVCRKMLDAIFEDYNVSIVQGITPLTNLGARWMSRKLGFTSHGVIVEGGKPHEYFMLTKQDWNNHG